MGEGDAPRSGTRPTDGRWTPADRAAAFSTYFRTGSRRRARKETGDPERTLSMWLRDERFGDERRAVQEALRRAVEQDAARRGAELVEATREAILVCRRALRREPDAKAASSLLTSLTRAREAEDRIQRLDHGGATEICGVTLAPEEQEAFREWQAERQAREALGDGELMTRLVEQLMEMASEPGTLRDALWAAVIRSLADQPGVLTFMLRDDLPLARRLEAALAKAIHVAEEQALAATPLVAESVPARGT